MTKWLFWFLLATLSSAIMAENISVKNTKWWEQRNKREDIYYPHNIHKQSMEQEGDSCMLCHTFNKNKVVEEKHLKALTTIANEPLEKICHDCHVTDLRAPWRCELCHKDKTKIWPDDHNFNYIDHHGEAARRNEAGCRACHLEVAYCSDCHLKRDTSGPDYHPMGYQSNHGIEARMMASNCGRCHNSFYCDDCHRVKR